MRERGGSETLSGAGERARALAQRGTAIQLTGAYDCPSSPGVLAGSADQHRPPALTRGRLDRVTEGLTARDWAILEALATVQVLTTAQVARLVFTGDSPETALRLARRHLARLRQSGLVRRFEDRARDRRVGAPGYVHALTAAGLRLSGGQHAVGLRQRKAWRPSYAFLTHRLALSELYVQLVLQERAGGPSLREYRAEADSWRRYSGPAGVPLRLQPDALVRLGIGDTEVSWFVEVDLDTETRPSTIQAKCQAYRTYELSGQEQRQYGVFPGVVFIVPNEKRARQIAAVIARQPPDGRELFEVVTEDQALALLSRPDDSLPTRPPPWG